MKRRIGLGGAIAIALALCGLPGCAIAQASGTPLRAKVRFESQPSGSTVTVRRGTQTMKRAKTPVSLVMTWELNRPFQAIFSRRNFEDCVRSFSVRALSPQEHALVVDTVMQTFPVGSARPEDVPVVSCTLQRTQGNR